MTSSINGLTGTFPVVNPAFRGGYIFSLDQIPGVVAANNYLSLENPTGSGRAILLAGVFVSTFNIAAVTAPAPLRGYLSTGISGGTAADAASIGKMRSSMPPSVGVIRTDNPTATLGAAIFNSPAQDSTGAGSASFVHQIPAAIPAGPLTLLPGEGVVLRTASGDTDQRWNLSIAWSEI